MEHRHLNHQDWTVAAIDSAITRGNQKDWNELRQDALDDPEVMEGLRKIAGNELNLASPFDDQCYREWWRWAQDPEREAWGPNLKDCEGV